MCQNPQNTAKYIKSRLPFFSKVSEDPKFYCNHCGAFSAYNFVDSVEKDVFHHMSEDNPASEQVKIHFWWIQFCNAFITDDRSSQGLCFNLTWAALFSHDVERSFHTQENRWRYVSNTAVYYWMY